MMQRCAVGLVEDVNCNPEWSQSYSLSWYQLWVWNTWLEETMFCLVLWLESLVYHSRSFMKVFKWMKLVSDQHVWAGEKRLNYISGHIPPNVQWSSCTLTSSQFPPLPLPDVLSLASSSKYTRIWPLLITSPFIQLIFISQLDYFRNHSIAIAPRPSILSKAARMILVKWKSLLCSHLPSSFPSHSELSCSHYIACQALVFPPLALPSLTSSLFSSSLCSSHTGVLLPQGHCTHCSFCLACSFM